jgi:ferredoxin
MKISIDTDRCEAHGDCVVAAPEIFDMGEDDDWATVIDDNPGESSRSAVELAARMCPVAAIRIEG